ncbi:hypothetical protein HFO91_30680 [Rhizobium leguminosarum]|uniref:hypothetical protein n=1 Tax=Rhizobium leguminosarum TaxID=384 RepID=UPI001C95DBC8|nr:hypothetical protein [Rhizobium leguminosarum]MBY5453947.1 hypothetical protein [Rhizobium leguminosarum]
MTHIIKKLIIEGGRVMVPFPGVISVCLISVEGNDFERTYLKILKGTIPVSRIEANDVIEFVAKDHRFPCRVSSLTDFVVSLELHKTTFQAIRAAKPLPDMVRSERDAGRFPMWRDIDFESSPPWHEFRSMLPDWKGARGDV